MSRRRQQPCGTDAGHRWHHYHGEQPCRPCLDAHAAKSRKGPESRGELAPCGTFAAYRRHLAHGEQPCAPCRAASAAQRAKYRARRRAIG